MAGRFIVNCYPRRLFAFPEVTPFARWDDPRGATGQQIEDVTVETFYKNDAEGMLLLRELSGLLDEVYKHTAHESARVLLGRSVFLEIEAHAINMVERWPATRIPLRVVSEEGWLEFRGVKCFMTPGDEYTIEAVPVASWLLSRSKPQRFIIERPAP